MKLGRTPSILLCLLYIQLGTSQNIMDRKLTEMLLKNYEKTTRPVDNSKDSVNVTMDIGLRALSSLDERLQSLRVKAWLRFYWYDASLKWNASQYGGLERTEILSSSIWLPDIVLINSDTNDPLSENDELVVVTNRGNVSWKFPVIIESQCKLDLTYFPFDVQVCQLKFASWVFAQAQMDLHAVGSRGDTSVFQESKSWILNSFKTGRNLTTYGSGDKFPDVTFYLSLTRRPLYVLFNLVLPVSMITVIGMLAFWLPPDDGEKIGLCVTMLVSLSFIMLLLADKMPPDVSVPLLGQFYAVVVIMLTITTVLSSIVIHTHFRGVRGKRVPKWLRVVVLKGLARFLCFDLTCKSDLYGDREGNLNTTSMKSFSNYGMTKDHETSDNEKSNNTQMIDSPVLHEINDKLQHIETTLMSRQKAEEEQGELDTDWRNVAMVIDRLFMWIYVIVCLLCGLALMLRRPPEN